MKLRRKKFAPVGNYFAPLCGLCWLLALASGCASAQLVPIALSPPPAPPDPATLEILVRSQAADPLPLRRSHVFYSQLGQALTQEIATAAQPWVRRNRERAQKTGGWQLLLSLTEAEATYQGGRARVKLYVRATLRTRVGSQHLAQTQTYCQQTAAVPATQASTVFTACLHDLRTELLRWLGGINP